MQIVYCGGMDLIVSKYGMHWQTNSTIVDAKYHADLRIRGFLFGCQKLNVNK